MKRVLTTLALALPLAVPVMSQAQQYPTRPVHIILSFTPGASMDLSARAIGQKMGESLGQPFVVDNKPGGNTIVSAEYTKNQPADGYTVFMALDTTMTLLPALYQKLPYDPVKDFAPVGRISQGAYVLIAPAKAPYGNVPELVKWAKSNPGKLNVGASTAFTQLLTVMLRQAANIDMQYIAYKGGPPMIQALMAGDLGLTVDGIPLYPPMVKAGKVKPIATTGAERAVQFPDVPTVREAGYPQLEAASMTGWFAPAGTPEAIIRRLNGELAKILKDPAFNQRNNESFQNPLMYSTPEELGRLVREGLAKWGPLVKQAGIKLD